MKHTKHVLVFILFVVAPINARVKNISSTKKFYKYVSKPQLALVLFYNESKQTNQNRLLRKQINQLERSFDSVSNLNRYKRAELRFFKVNVAKKDLMQLQQDFNITQLPSIMLFTTGQQVSQTLVGFVDRNDIRSFIETNFGKNINEILQWKERERRRNRARMYISYGYNSAFYTPYYNSYTYPYWYWPYGGYGYGGGLGVGVSFGY